MSESPATGKICAYEAAARGGGSSMCLPLLRLPALLHFCLTPPIVGAWLMTVTPPVLGRHRDRLLSEVYMELAQLELMAANDFKWKQKKMITTSSTIPIGWRGPDSPGLSITHQVGGCLSAPVEPEHRLSSPVAPADSSRVAGPLKPRESGACGRLSEAALSFKPTDSNIRWVGTHRRRRRKGGKTWMTRLSPEAY
ncbi:unnamed protein product [Pleuronectes platessa]|uniref:Uncharacterized protein n=1 Tax=Pleuronectes platessa TaxID=8262 RepID=A0A9N7W220_PLEPL|nr:unnamed protein product [Pleuronectes platessa]